MDSYIDEHKTLFVVDKNGYILKMIENYTKHDNCRTCDIEDNGMNFYIVKIVEIINGKPYGVKIKRNV